MGDKFLAITKKCFEVGGYVQRWKMRLAVTENGGHVVGMTTPPPPPPPPPLLLLATSPSNC